MHGVSRQTAPGVGWLRHRPRPDAGKGFASRRRRYSHPQGDSSVRRLSKPAFTHEKSGSYKRPGSVHPIPEDSR
ncbi:hypothetical protein SZ55_1724 [Pseudomonas sp. FeS53a]|nr:hypothetical protein SZ55_1724 [Pseudomonas sp. FeS53a]